MIGHWPDPLPDELLYSVIARLATQWGDPSPRHLGEVLFGCPSPRAVVDWPRHLERLSTRIGEPFDWSPDALRERLTFWPYYAPFWPEHRRQFMANAMAGDRIGLEMISGLLGQVRPPVLLHWCSACVVTDRHRYRTAYWHRGHQLPGVLVCPHHDIPLRASPVARSQRRSILRYVDLDTSCDEWADTLEPAAAAKPAWQHVARLSQDLLDHPRMGLDSLATLSAHLRAATIAAGWGRGRSQIAMGPLKQAIRDQFGEDFLADVGLAVDSSDSWIDRLYHARPRIPAPLMVILIAIASDVALDDVLVGGAHVRSVQDLEAYPCPHRDILVHRKERPLVAQPSAHDRAAAVWTCGECGLSFASGQTPPARRHVLQWGHRWDAELTRVVRDSQCSLRRAARLLAVDPTTLKRQMVRLGLVRAEWTMPPAVSPSENPVSDREVHRQAWQTLRAAHPTAGRTDLRQLAPALWVRLERNDKVWFENNQPLRKLSRGGRHVDWTTRDAALADAAADAVERIRAQRPPVRVTQTAIGRELQHMAWVRRYDDRLPLLAAFIESVAESPEDFAHRRVQVAIQEMRRKREPMHPWRIARRAGLRPRHVHLAHTVVTKGYSKFGFTKSV